MNVSGIGSYSESLNGSRCSMCAAIHLRGPASRSGRLSGSARRSGRATARTTATARHPRGHRRARRHSSATWAADCHRRSPDRQSDRHYLPSVNWAANQRSNPLQPALLQAPPLRHLERAEGRVMRTATGATRAGTPATQQISCQLEMWSTNSQCPGQAPGQGPSQGPGPSPGRRGARGEVRRRCAAMAVRELEIPEVGIFIYIQIISQFGSRSRDCCCPHRGWFPLPACPSRPPQHSSHWGVPHPPGPLLQHQLSTACTARCAPLPAWETS